MVKEICLICKSRRNLFFIKMPRFTEIYSNCCPGRDGIESERQKYRDVPLDGIYVFNRYQETSYRRLVKIGLG